MSFKIEFDNNLEWYTSHDKISGTVSLDSKTSVEITKVDVHLIGISHVALTRVDDKGQKFTDHVDETITFLDNSLQLFPPADQVHGDKYSVRPGVHKWHFTFEVPLSSEPELTDKNSLPPSLSDIDPENGYIKYLVRAEIEKSSILHLGLNKSIVEKPVVFLPGDNVDLEAVPTYGVFNAQLSRVQTNPKSVSGLLARIVTTLAHDRAQTCAGIASFEVRSELLLTPGLKFSFVIESMLLKPDERVSIYGVKIELISKTLIRAKNLEEVEEHSIVLFSKSDLKLRFGDIMPQLGNPSLKIPENVPPTFETQNLRREYRLEIQLKWSHRPSSLLVHKAQLGRKVWIRSGMYSSPSYYTGEIIRAERQFPQAKWYYK